MDFKAVVYSIFASRLIDPKLAPTAIDRAFRLYMLPQGILLDAPPPGPLPLARAARRPRRSGRISLHDCARVAVDRVPADPGECRKCVARRADQRASCTSAARLFTVGHPGGCGARRRAASSRPDAVIQVRVLLTSVVLCSTRLSPTNESSASTLRSMLRSIASAPGAFRSRPPSSTSQAPASCSSRCDAGRPG